MAKFSLVVNELAKIQAEADALPQEGEEAQIGRGEVQQYQAGE